MTANSGPIEIRRVETFEEMDACIDLQRRVWQFRDLDLVPRRMFVVARAVGGHIVGAWNQAGLIGYALAIPGIRDGTPYLHSHMVAVAPEYRDRGVGFRLKLGQREEALARGIDRIEWTFDPLQRKNARFNLNKLGAIVRRYSPDFYGHSTSPLHGALPTDRLHAEWWLRSKRVEAAVAGRQLPEYYVNETVTVTEMRDPVNSSAPEVEWLLHLRRQFLSAFEKGLAGLGVATGDSAMRYLLGPCSPESDGGLEC